MSSKLDFNSQPPVDTRTTYIQPDTHFIPSTHISHAPVCWSTSQSILQDRQYERPSRKKLVDRLTVYKTWLFGDHNLYVLGQPTKHWCLVDLIHKTNRQHTPTPTTQMKKFAQKEHLIMTTALGEVKQWTTNLAPATKASLLTMLKKNS